MEQASQTNPAAHRRRFVQKSALALGALGAALVGRRAAHPPSAQAAPALPEAPGNDLIRMQRELDASLARPPEQRSWVMVVDTRRCVGCNACTIACRAENVTGPAGSYRRVRRIESGAGAWLAGTFKPANCMQCDNPPCAKAAPQGMVRKRADGIVEFDYERLRGTYAHAVAAACPYKAVHVDDGRRFTDSTPELQPYELRTFRENGRQWSRREQGALAGVARKCHFCSHLLEAGLLPACVTTCIGGAMYFGDLKNAAGLAAGLLRERKVMRLNEDWGTLPRVYYVTDPYPNTAQAACNACHY
jgi:tetrathionate reductase subunit B